MSGHVLTYDIFGRSYLHRFLHHLTIRLSGREVEGRPTKTGTIVQPVTGVDVFRRSLQIEPRRKQANPNRWVIYIRVQLSAATTAEICVCLCCAYVQIFARGEGGEGMGGGGGPYFLPHWAFFGGGGYGGGGGGGGPGGGYLQNENWNMYPTNGCGMLGVGTEKTKMALGYKQDRNGHIL